VKENVLLPRGVAVCAPHHNVAAVAARTERVKHMRASRKTLAYLAS